MLRPFRTPVPAFAWSVSTNSAMAWSKQVCAACASACHCVQMSMLHAIDKIEAQRQLCFAETTA